MRASSPLLSASKSLSSLRYEKSTLSLLPATNSSPRTLPYGKAQWSLRRLLYFEDVELRRKERVSWREGEGSIYMSQALVGLIHVRGKGNPWARDEHVTSGSTCHRRSLSSKLELNASLIISHLTNSILSPTFQASTFSLYLRTCYVHLQTSFILNTYIFLSKADIN